MSENKEFVNENPILMKKSSQPVLSGINPYLLAIENKQAYTSFGKLPLSEEGSKPQYSFGSGNRFLPKSQFLNKELAENQLKGENIYGPKYNIVGAKEMKYNRSPKYSIGNEIRYTLGIKPTDEIEGDMFMDDPINSDKSRKLRSPTFKFGTSTREGLDYLEKHPGPQYYPSLKPEVPKQPLYSLGSRRDYGPGALTDIVGTTETVGPGSYFPEKCISPSTKKDYPNYAFQKSNRPPLYFKPSDKNQTYAIVSSLKDQPQSQKKTEPRPRIGKGSRDANNKLGFFKDMMAQPPLRVVLPHPKF